MIAWITFETVGNAARRKLAFWARNAGRVALPVFRIEITLALVTTGTSCAVSISYSRKPALIARLARGHEAAA